MSCTYLFPAYPPTDSATRSYIPLPRGFHTLDQSGPLLSVYAQRLALGLNALIKGRPHNFFSNVLRLFNLATEELVEPGRLGDWCECQRAENEKSRSGARWTGLSKQT